MNNRLITLNFCEKCRKEYGSKDLKRNLHNELLCKKCYAKSELNDEDKK